MYDHGRTTSQLSSSCCIIFKKKLICWFSNWLFVIKNEIYLENNVYPQV